jgi:hypothetical protein
MKNRKFLTPFALTSIFACLVALNASAVVEDEEVDVVSGTATIDGDKSEWNTHEDLYAKMCKAGDCESNAHMSSLYLRYDCNSQIMYALVLREGGYNPIGSAENAWLSIDGTQVDPTPAAWVYDDDTLIGYEASFPLLGGTYNMEAQIRIAPGFISSTGNEGNEIQVEVPESCNASGTGAALFHLGSEEEMICYDQREYDEKSCHEKQGKRLPPYGVVQSTAWYANKTCRDFRFQTASSVSASATGVAKRVTFNDSPLTANAVEEGVELTLTTVNEKKTSALAVYQVMNFDQGLVQFREVCRWKSRGDSQSSNIYSCIDKNISSNPSVTVSYWAVDVSDKGIYTHHLETTVTVK